ncbi:dihydroorotate dehydrogenase [Acidianus sulfidivorans JP7]|uniref:Dihydroorotate dehydrogenase n=1 Tax=Acidianus sulfidivorans JP7 TaxID=619593 RepID=A0A2U9INI7_9CREN|nr:dihydroorotate dehydrogenase PyrD [Acidianus sulfidivorans]AWR97575.1 dihydroorotate dehydrogenase [Acidianus sulfidivorans JP7]
MKIANLNFEDPIIIASGIVPDIPKFIQKVCEKYKPSAITTKTFTLNPINPHNPPTVIKFADKCYMNAIGLGNPGINTVNEIDIKCKLFVSIGGNNIDEIVKASIIAEKKADLIEINVSSPNRKGYGESLANLTHEIVKNVKSSISKPVFVKLGPWDNVLEIAGKALEAGADGLTLINTLKGLYIDTEEYKSVLNYGTGGISGKCIFPLALRIIRDVYTEYEADIIGVGGVFSYRDVLSMISVGAKLVGLGTVIIDQGFNSIPRIRNNLYSYLNKKGLKLESIFSISVKK